MKQFYQTVKYLNCHKAIGEAILILKSQNLTPSTAVFFFNYSAKYSLCDAAVKLNINLRGHCTTGDYYEDFVYFLKKMRNFGQSSQWI